jgi:hypothetical protein
MAHEHLTKVAADGIDHPGCTLLRDSRRLDLIENGVDELKGPRRIVEVALSSGASV